MLFMIPTYVLPYLGSNSSLVNVAFSAAASWNPFFLIHLLSLLILCALALARGVGVRRVWLVVFPAIATAFDLLPMLNFVPLVPSVMHCLCLILGVSATPSLAANQSKSSIVLEPIPPSDEAESVPMQFETDTRAEGELANNPTIDRVPEEQRTKLGSLPALAKPTGRFDENTRWSSGPSAQTKSKTSRSNDWASYFKQTYKPIAVSAMLAIFGVALAIAPYISAVGHTASELRVEYAKKASQVNNIYAELTTANQRINSLDSDNATLKTKLLESELEVTRLQARFKDTQQQAPQSLSDQSFAQSQLEVSLLKAKVVDLTSQIETMKNPGDAQAPSITSLQEQVSDLKDALSSHEQDSLKLTLLQGKVSSLTAELESTRSDLNNTKEAYLQAIQQLEKYRTIQQNATPPQTTGTTTAQTQSGDSAQFPIEQVRTFATFENEDVVGTDISALRNIDLNNCRSTCATNDKCVAAVFDRWNAICFLKSDASALRLDPRATALVDTRVSRPSPLATEVRVVRYHKRAFPGDGYQTLRSPDAGVCESACTDQKACVAFSFQTVTKLCQLFDRPEAYSADSQAESGVKIQPMN